jgi:hypothetical protein
MEEAKLMPLSIRASLIAAVIVAGMFLPYLPGGHDPLAKPLSGAAWALQTVWLLFVPVGGLWLLASKVPTGHFSHRWLSRVTQVTAVIAMIAVVLMAFASSGSLLLSFGVGLGISSCVVRRIRQLRDFTATSISRKSLVTLTAAPILVLLAQMAFVEPIASRARERVIANSAPLIAEIENYRARRGVYPISLFSLYGDYKPAIIGVQRYHYEASGDAYNVVFEEPSLGLGGRRFVVYNPRDKQRLTVHETDRLRLDEAGLDADNAGYTIVRTLPQAHWKLFTFRS